MVVETKEGLRPV